MKRKLFILFLLVFPFFCFAQRQNNPEFKITTDTVNIYLKDKVSPATKIGLSHAVKLNNKYYCFFNEYDYYSWLHSRRFQHFFIITKEGTIEHSIEFPKRLGQAYSDFFIRNDSIIAKEYYNHKTYYFDIDKLKWKQIEEADDVIYEDADFYVTYRYFGEFGCRTWFKDKKTNKEYDIYSEGHIINKIDNVYYITDKHQILMIENPLELNPCELQYYYKTVKKNRSYCSSNSLKGAKEIYKDSTYRWWFDRPKSHIITSFIHNNELFHLYNDDDNKTISITKLENGNLITVNIFLQKKILWLKLFV